MENFEENLTSKVDELKVNLSKFVEKNNNAAGSRARKNAQQLKKMLQDLRVDILAKQKENKANKANKKSAATETANNEESEDESEDE